MKAKPQGRSPRVERPSHPHDLARERWNTRMAWSMMAATAMHAAIFASWPTRGAPGIAFDLSPALDQPQWMFLDALGSSSGPDDEAGGSKDRQPSSPVAPDPVNRVTVTKEDASADAEALRDRLVRGSSLAPSISTPAIEDVGDDPNAIVTGPSGVDRATSTAGLSDAEIQALQGLSDPDLERLRAIRPDVALEASSAWVLVRNPTAVMEFMRRNAVPRERVMGPNSAVSVALWVSAAGAVEWAEVITSSGRSEWDDLALTLFEDVVTFRPARLEGVPMPMSAIFTVDFPWY